MLIEKIVRDFLAGALDTAVVTEIPEPMPECFVLLEKTASSRENGLDAATLAVQSYAPSLLAAAELNEEAKAALDRLAELPQVSASRLNSDYNFTDTRTKRYRYQAVYDIYYYGG